MNRVWIFMTAFLTKDHTMSLKLFLKPLSLLASEKFPKIFFFCISVAVKSTLITFGGKTCLIYFHLHLKIIFYFKNIGKLVGLCFWVSLILCGLITGTVLLK